MENIFSGLSLIIAIGAAVSLFMRYIRQPLIIGYILTGILVGPAVFSVLHSPKSLTVFGDIGIALLLFIIGLGMNPRVIKEVGRPAVLVTATQMVVVASLSWLLLTALGLSHTEALFVSFGLTVNSTIVALKLLSDKKEIGRLYGKLTIGASLVEDIIAAIALIFIASADNGHWSIGPVFSLAFKGVVIGAGMYFVTRHLLPKAQKLIASDQELLFLCAIAWGLGSAALLAKAGFSMEIGALAAGISLASLPYAPEIGARLRPLRDFFVIVFFISLGTELTFSNFGELFWPIIFGTIIVVALKPLTVMTTLGFLGYTKRTSFKTAITLSQVSEFSIILVILGVSKGLIDQHIVTMLTFIALISIAISTYMVTFGDQLYAKLEKHLNMFERRKESREQIPAEERNELVLFGYQRGGHEFTNLFKKLKKKYVVIDYDPEVADLMDSRKINYLYGDATDVELLEEAGVTHAKLVVSTIPDLDVNAFLLNYLKLNNPQAIGIFHADDPLDAAKLYEAGASYVILPHYIGSEKVSSFISKSGLAKHAFRKERIKHLDYLERHYGALEKLSEINEKRVGRTIIRSMTHLTKAKD